MTDLNGSTHPARPPAADASDIPALLTQLRRAEQAQLSARAVAAHFEEIPVVRDYLDMKKQATTAAADIKALRAQLLPLVQQQFALTGEKAPHPYLTVTENKAPAVLNPLAAVLWALTQLPADADPLDTQQIVKVVERVATFMPISLRREQVAAFIGSLFAGESALAVAQPTTIVKFRLSRSLVDDPLDALPLDGEVSCGL